MIAQFMSFCKPGVTFGEMESRTMPSMTATTDAIPHIVLPTVLEHCTPAIRGEDDDFHDPLCMYTVPPCVYNRRVGPFGRTQRSALLAEHIRSLNPDIDTRLNQLPL